MWPRRTKYFTYRIFLLLIVNKRKIKPLSLCCLFVQFLLHYLLFVPKTRWELMILIFSILVLWKLSSLMSSTVLIKFDVGFIIVLRGCLEKIWLVFQRLQILIWYGKWLSFSVSIMNWICSKSWRDRHYISSSTWGLPRLSLEKYQIDVLLCKVGISFLCS